MGPPGTCSFFPTCSVTLFPAVALNILKKRLNCEIVSFGGYFAFIGQRGDGVQGKDRVITRKRRVERHRKIAKKIRERERAKITTTKKV